MCFESLVIIQEAVIQGATVTGLIMTFLLRLRLQADFERFNQMPGDMIVKIDYEGHIKKMNSTMLKLFE